MRLFRITVALLLVLALAATASAAGKGKKNKKAAKPIRGVIVAVDQDQGKDTGTITVRVQKGKKKAAADTPAEEKKITVSGTTKLTTVSGKKGQKQTTDAAFKDLAKDQRVVVKATGASADSVTIMQHGKKAKKNKAA